MFPDEILLLLRHTHSPRGSLCDFELSSEDDVPSAS